MVLTTEMDLGQPKLRVNGSQIASHRGRGVCLIGNARNMSQNGTSFTLTATDGEDVLVNMSQPVQENVEGLVEVHGVVDAQNAIQGAHYVKFPAEAAEKFDMETYSKALQMITQYPEHYIQGVQAS